MEGAQPRPSENVEHLEHLPRSSIKSRVSRPWTGAFFGRCSTCSLRGGWAMPRQCWCVRTASPRCSIAAVDEFAAATNRPTTCPTEPLARRGLRAPPIKMLPAGAGLWRRCMAQGARGVTSSARTACANRLLRVSRCWPARSLPTKPSQLATAQPCAGTR
jgi:hypothetical protein